MGKRLRGIASVATSKHTYTKACARARKTAQGREKTKVSSRESHLLQPRPTGPRGLPPRRNLLRTFQSVLRLLFLDGLFPIPAMFLSCDGVPTLSLIFPSCSASSCLPDMGPTEAQYKETRLGTSLVSLRFSSAPFVR